MTSVSHEPHAAGEHRPRTAKLAVPELWPSVAIVAMWLAVLVDAIVGPDIESISGVPGAGGTSTTIPSAVAIALFAFLGTWVVARHGFGRPKPDE